MIHYFRSIEEVLQAKHARTHGLRAVYRAQYPDRPGLSQDQADEHVIRYYYINPNLSMRRTDTEMHQKYRQS